MNLEQNRKITVKGIGKLSAKPDQVEISLTLTSVKKEYQDSIESGNNLVLLVKKSFEEKGFDQESIKTSDFSIDTKYENYQDDNQTWQQRFVGYETINQLKITFDFSQEHLGEAIQAIAASETNPEIGINFTLKDKDTFKCELLKLAVKNARDNAQIIAGAAGVIIDEVVKINYLNDEINFYSSTSFETRALKASNNMAVSINPSNIDLTETVEVEWSIN